MPRCDPDHSNFSSGLFEWSRLRLIWGTVPWLQGGHGSRHTLQAIHRTAAHKHPPPSLTHLYHFLLRTSACQAFAVLWRVSSHDNVHREDHEDKHCWIVSPGAAVGDRGPAGPVGTMRLLPPKAWSSEYEGLGTNESFQGDLFGIIWLFPNIGDTPFMPQIE